MSEDYTTSVITPNTGVYAPIADAYSFRCLMDFVGATVSDIHLVFETRVIHMTQTDSYKTILHRMSILTSNLVDYYLNPSYETIMVGVDMRELRAKIKNAQKKQTTLTLFNNMENLTQFMATVNVPNQSTSGGTLFIPTKRLPDEGVVEVDDYDDVEPSIVVQVVDLARAFGYIANSKCKYAQIDCHARGLLIRGVVSGNTAAIQPLGKCANPYNVGEDRAAELNGPVVATYVISSANIKPFAKINNISPPNATLRVYYAADRPLKITFPIGTIGTHEVFLMTVDPATMKPE